MVVADSVGRLASAGVAWLLGRCAVKTQPAAELPAAGPPSLAGRRDSTGFVESDLDGRPFDRDARSLVYERAKYTHSEHPFGTELKVYETGYEWFNHSIAPHARSEEPFRVEVGGPQCTQPYSMAMLNVSAMSFGALSKNAIMALNKGARLGGFAHDTSEGRLTEYHLKHGGDLIWEIGSGYFGCRTSDGNFDLDEFRGKSQHETVKCISVKLSQGAKPGLGGVMPAVKVTQEIADIRCVPVGKKCVSPPLSSSVPDATRIRSVCSDAA